MVSSYKPKASATTRKVRSIQYLAYAVKGKLSSDAFEDREEQHQCYQLAESVLRSEHDLQEIIEKRM